MIITRIYSIQQHIFCPLTVLSGICRYDVYYSNENCWPSLSKNKRNNFSPYDKLSVTWGYKISRFQIYDNHGLSEAMIYSAVHKMELYQIPIIQHKFFLSYIKYSILLRFLRNGWLCFSWSVIFRNPSLVSTVATIFSLLCFEREWNKELILPLLSWAYFFEHDFYIFIFNVVSKFIS